jgi:hypothetical protein
VYCFAHVLSRFAFVLRFLFLFSPFLASLAGVTGASLKTTRYNAALQTGKGDDSATIAYYIRYLSLDRILEENTQISERICDALAAQVMQRVAAQLPTINGDWVHAYTTILWTELDSGYITNQQAKGPMKSATLLAALRVHVPAHTQVRTTCVLL